MSRFRLMVKTSVAVALALVVMACGSSNSRAPQFDTTTGKHPATWLATHFVAFNQNQASCAPCHGSVTDPTSNGGTSGINCFFCHAQQNPPVTVLHPAGWANPANHGATAKQPASLTAGFAHCAACHGNSYNATLSNPGGPVFSCFTCHTSSPHPDAPWHGLNGGTNHNSTDPSNVTECAKCHTAGANLTSIVFRQPAPAGTAPGCFNNTLCHGNNPGHIVNWSSPLNHGFGAAMKDPATTSADAPKGFANCVSCHGASFGGGTGTSCFTCHLDAQGVAVNAPHPARPWNNLNSATNSHDLTNQANAPVCFQCHAGGTNSILQPSAPPAAGAAPGCFNNTLCHGTNP